MEDKKTAQPQLGTWERLPTQDVERDPKISFDINIPVEVEFKTDAPIEMPSDTSQEGVYYIFKVKCQNRDMIIMTSAWTLLRTLKVLSPLKGKRVQITKRIIKGKQTFEVIEVKKVN